MSGGNAYKRKSHRRIEVITSVAAVVVLYVILESFGVTCPIKYITGISCAGCGMSRAWISLLHFNIHDAFMYHPLFFLPMCEYKSVFSPWNFPWGRNKKYNPNEKMHLPKHTWQ